MVAYQKLKKMSISQSFSMEVSEGRRLKVNVNSNVNKKENVQCIINAYDTLQYPRLRNNTENITQLVYTSNINSYVQDSSKAPIRLCFHIYMQQFIKFQDMIIYTKRLKNAVSKERNSTHILLLSGRNTCSNLFSLSFLKDKWVCIFKQSLCESYSFLELNKAQKLIFLKYSFSKDKCRVMNYEQVY